MNSPIYHTTRIRLAKEEDFIYLKSNGDQVEQYFCVGMWFVRYNLDGEPIESTVRYRPDTEDRLKWWVELKQDIRDGRVFVLHPTTRTDRKELSAYLEREKATWGRWQAAPLFGTRY